MFVRHFVVIHQLGWKAPMAQCRINYAYANLNRLLGFLGRCIIVVHDIWCTATPLQTRIPQQTGLLAAHYPVRNVVQRGMYFHIQFVQMTITMLTWVSSFTSNLPKMHNEWLGHTKIMFGSLDGSFPKGGVITVIVVAFLLIKMYADTFTTNQIFVPLLFLVLLDFVSVQRPWCRCSRGGWACRYWQQRNPSCRSTNASSQSAHPLKKLFAWFLLIPSTKCNHCLDESKRWNSLRASVFNSKLWYACFSDIFMLGCSHEQRTKD